MSWTPCINSTKENLKSIGESDTQWAVVRLKVVRAILSQIRLVSSDRGPLRPSRHPDRPELQIPRGHRPPSRWLEPVLPPGQVEQPHRQQRGGSDRRRRQDEVSLLLRTCHRSGWRRQYPCPQRAAVEPAQREGGEEGLQPCLGPHAATQPRADQQPSAPAWILHGRCFANWR